MGRNRSGGGVRDMAASMIGGSEQNIGHTGLHGSPSSKGMRDNSINGLKLLTNQQKDGDSPFGTIVTGLWREVAAGSWTGSGSSFQKTITKQ